MTNEAFEKLVRSTFDTCGHVLGIKADEYARGDRLSNFKQAATLQRCSYPAALIGMWTKHVVALYDFVNDLENGQEQTIERWDEKIIDSINYLILLRALIYEHIA